MQMEKYAAQEAEHQRVMNLEVTISKDGETTPSTILALLIQAAHHVLAHRVTGLIIARAILTAVVQTHSSIHQGLVIPVGHQEVATAAFQVAEAVVAQAVVHQA
jgi:hypothetical protein